MWKETWNLRLFGLWKIPLLWFVRPSVIRITEQGCVIRIPLTRRTRNHLGSMYFGVLCVGADIAGGLVAMNLIQQGGNRVSLIFKEFRAEFLKRPEGDVHFTCNDGPAIAALVTRATESGERENLPVIVTATVPSKPGDEPVARFELLLSLKRRGD